MLKTFAKAATIVSLCALGACNTTTATTRTAPDVGGTPAADAANPSINPDGTVKRLYVNR